MSNETPLVKIDLTPEYKRNLRKLSKKYRQIRSDVQPIIEPKKLTEINISTNNCK